MTPHHLSLAGHVGSVVTVWSQLKDLEVLGAQQRAQAPQTGIAHQSPSACN